MAVRRGEAYYDDNGNIVYGTPPTEPEVLQDELGNYYILDENGSIVYTDESGTPIQPALPPEGTGSEGTGDTTGSADGTAVPGPRTPAVSPRFPETAGRPVRPAARRRAPGELVRPMAAAGLTAPMCRTAGPAMGPPICRGAGHTGGAQRG